MPNKQVSPIPEQVLPPMLGLYRWSCPGCGTIRHFNEQRDGDYRCWKCAMGFDGDALIGAGLVTAKRGHCDVQVDD